MHCVNCNGDMIGDGFTSVLHCEYAESESYWFHEPDAAPVYCEFDVVLDAIPRHVVEGEKYED